MLEKTRNTTETLWSKVIEKYPKNAVARRGRGKYYYLMSSKAKSVVEKKKLEDKALISGIIQMLAGESGMTKSSFGTVFHK